MFVLIKEKKKERETKIYAHTPSSDREVDH